MEEERKKTKVEEKSGKRIRSQQKKEKKKIYKGKGKKEREIGIGVREEGIRVIKGRGKERGICCSGIVQGYEIKI